jgi:hypothetical protein
MMQLSASTTAVDNKNTFYGQPKKGHLHLSPPGNQQVWAVNNPAVSNVFCLLISLLTGTNVSKMDTQNSNTHFVDVSF